MNDQMETNEIETFDSGPIPVADSGRSVRRLICYLLRAAVRRVSKEKVGHHRYSNLCSEMQDALLPMLRSTGSVLGFFDAFCERFGVRPGQDESTPYPLRAWLPRETHNAFDRVDWKRVLTAIDIRVLELVIAESPAFIASFACQFVASDDWETIQLEERQFADIPDPSPPNAKPPRLPRNPIYPERYQTVWTLTSPMSHGADEKSGNVSMFRRGKTVDKLTGKHVLVPFMSGNAVRGMWRDLMFSKFLQLVEIDPKQMPSSRVHALFAGGSIEAGADSAGVNLATRRAARAICPPWDMFAGCIDNQIMQGRLRVHDAMLVCRENAWDVSRVWAPEIATHAELEAFAAGLPEASSLTTLRLGTRQAHKEFDGAEGSQMLFNVELLMPGAQMLHSFQVFSLDGVSQVTLSSLSYLLEEFAKSGAVGAQTSKGFGQVLLDPYQAKHGAAPLPPSDVFVEFCAKNKAQIVDWLMEAPKASEPKPKAQAKSRGKEKKANAEPVPSDVSLA